MTELLSKNEVNDAIEVLTVALYNGKISRLAFGVAARAIVDRIDGTIGEAVAEAEAAIWTQEEIDAFRDNRFAASGSIAVDALAAEAEGGPTGDGRDLDLARD